MRIDSSTLDMESTRTYASITAKKVTVSTARGGKELTGGLGGLFGNLLNADGNMEEAGKGGNSAELEDISAHFKNLSNVGRFENRDREKDTAFTLKQQCMKFLMELLFGWRREKRWDDMLAREGSGEPAYQVKTYTNQYYHREEECTTFSTVGMVKTSDGREIPFNLEFGMSRSFEEYYEENYSKVTSYCDPLVINLDVNTAQVSDQKFFFDLDCDGKEEEISALEGGSGFLALDFNGDGVINDGSELFGTKSGNGFADLSKYDADGNGWIDEGDDIWEKLLIWTKDEKGNDKLYHLSDLGIGAIGLSNVSTQFSINSNQDNTTNAMLRKTGIFLYENGTVSTIQHLDLAR